MNLNPIKSVYNFNKEAGLLDTGYSDERECAFPIEEALEGLDSIDYLYEILGGNNKWEVDPTPKNISRILVDIANTGANEISDVDRFDKHLDIIVFSLGSIFKLGLTPQQMMRGLQIVATANMQKLKAGKDEHGKQLKPVDFISPEPLLEKILQERNENGK